MRLGFYFAAAIVMATLTGCSSAVPDYVAREFAAPRPFEPNHYIAVEKEIPLVLASHDGKSADEVFSHGALSSGQFVLTSDLSPTNLVATLGVRQDLPYSHVGFLVIEDGVPFVYSMHSGDVDVRKLGTDGALVGGIDRESLKKVIRSNPVVSIFNPPPDADRVKLIAYIKNAYAQHVPFDPFFDAEDHSRLYCGEFIAVALEHAGAHPPRPVLLRNNAAIAYISRSLKIHDAYFLSPGLFADPARHVATFSAALNPNQIAAYLAVPRELFQRFTDDQRFGALIEIQDNGGARLRPSIGEFISQVLSMARFAKTSDPEQMAEMVHRFAGKFFSDD